MPNQFFKRLFAFLTQDSSHAPRWSVVGGGMTMLCNAATLPSLYFLLDKAVFAEWATALACLNLWCFPEGARTLLVTSGYIGTSDARIGLRGRLLLVSCGCAVMTILGQLFWQNRSGAETSILSYMTPEIILSLGIPLRFLIAERRGELQAQGKWRRQALVMGCLNLCMSAGLILAAWLTHHVGIIAATYFLGLMIQSFALYLSSSGAVVKSTYPLAGHAPTFMSALALSLGPLIFTQGDKLILQHLLDVQIFADYTMYTALAGQISLLSALPCVPLVAWFQQPRDARARLLSTAQNWNMYLVLFSIAGLLVGFAIIQALFPYSKFGSLSLQVGGALILIYGAFSLNGPGYFLLLGHGQFNLAGYCSLVLALISVVAIGVLASYYGLYGAIAGNSVFVLTIFMGISAAKLSREASHGWGAGTWLAVALLGLALFILVG